MKYRFVKLVPIFDGTPTSSYATEQERIESAPGHLEHMEPGRYALVKIDGNVMIAVGEWDVKRNTTVAAIEKKF